MPKQRNFLKFIILITLVCGFGIVSPGCGILKPNSKRKVEKKEEAAQKKAEKVYASARKQHYKHQSSDTRKMMKQTRRNASKFNHYKRRTGFGKTKCD